MVWDGRWRVSAPCEASGGLYVGALGAQGCDRLGREARAGAWAGPAGWAAAPRPVRETVPAVFAAPDRAPESLLAVPPAGYLVAGAPPAVAGIEAAPARPPAATP
jgi:hypothetical protein